MDFTARELETQLRQTLVPVAAGWGLRVDERHVQLFLQHAQEMLRWNQHTNLTRVTAPADIVVRHFLDSLACALVFDAPPASLIDVGTGAGFPGLPLKFIWPELRLVLSDSAGKKTAFVQHVVDALALDGVEVVTARAEQLGRAPEHREQYDAVVARAVAALNVLAEYCLPLCRVGGCFVAPKGSDGAAEADAAHDAIELLGGAIEAIIPVILPQVEARTLVVVRKVRPTPDGYPRAVGLAAKRPLGPHPRPLSRPKGTRGGRGARDDLLQ